MRNHWESSTRPLFVKTVFVDGSRHAILFQEDPLLRSKISSLGEQKRPDSSVSFASTLSISTSESQDSAFEKRIKSSKRKNVGKDISSELQGCLIKLRFGSSIQKNKDKARNQQIFQSLQEEEKWIQNKGNENIRQKKKKWNHGRVPKKRNYGNCYREYMNENNVTGPRNESSNCYYVYNFENDRGKKNYCFVKISSKPSQCILNCSCVENGAEIHDLCGPKATSHPGKNNVVLSETFHNLIMNSDQRNTPSNVTPDCLVSLSNYDSCKLYWNNYLSGSFYTSLSERVIQWMDLTNKRKKGDEKLESTSEDVPLNNIERIFAGRTFVDDNYKSRYSDKYNDKKFNQLENKPFIKRERQKITQKEASVEDVETEVKGEGNVETILSNDKLQNECQECCQNLRSTKRVLKSQNLSGSAFSRELSKTNEDDRNTSMISIPTKTDSDSSVPFYLQDSISNRFVSTSNSNFTKSATNIKEVLLSDHMEDACNSFSSENKKKTSKRNSLTRQSKRREFDEKQIANVRKDNTITSIKYWNKGMVNTNNMSDTLAQRFEINKDTMACNYDRNSDEIAQWFKNRNSMQESLGKNQKSIDNENITRIILNQNPLSPQQNKSPWLREGKSAWLPEKDLGRPQLHIFIPSIPSKEPSEESLSECESYLSEVYQ